MWWPPVPDGLVVPDAPFLVPIPGLGPVLVLLAFAVLAGLVWLIRAQVRPTERRVVSCPVDRVACVVVTDPEGRLLACSPSPAFRGVDCRAACLAA